MADGAMGADGAMIFVAAGLNVAIIVPLTSQGLALDILEGSALGWLALIALARVRAPRTAIGLC